MIYVVRHGQTDLNKEGRLQGRRGLPLNEEGLRQAEALRERLRTIRFDLVFSSPQERAVQTAAIASGLQPVTDPRLDVFDIGEADTLKRSEAKFAGVVPDPSLYAGVEDIRLFVKRIFHFMQELRNEYGGSERNVLISGHRCTTGCIGAYFEGMPEDGNVLRYSSENGHYKVYSLAALRDPDGKR